MRAIFETRFAKVGETAEHYSSIRINSSEESKRFVRHYLASYFEDKLDQEEFLVAILDTKYRVRKVVRITRGTLDSSLVHPREVFRPAVAEAASAVLLIHNHPSGDPTPSEADLAITKRLVDCGNLLGINVIDHIVSGENCSISLREMGFVRF